MEKTKIDRATKEKVYAFFSSGNEKYKLGDYAGAIADYDRAIELKPDFVVAKHNRKIVIKKMEEQK